MTRRTPLFDLHQKLGARIVDFGGWDMPVQYGSQIAEHHAVRRGAGVFDVSHMCVVDLKGARVAASSQKLLANDVGKLQAPGKALYGCMLKESGGIIDDLIVYFLDESLVPRRRQRGHARQRHGVDSPACGGFRQSTSSSAPTSPCSPCRARKRVARRRHCFHPPGRRRRSLSSRSSDAR